MVEEIQGIGVCRPRERSAEIDAAGVAGVIEVQTSMSSACNDACAAVSRRFSKRRWSVGDGISSDSDEQQRQEGSRDDG